MQKSLPYLSVLFVLLYALYNAKFHQVKETTKRVNHTTKQNIQYKSKIQAQEELKKIKKSSYLKQYIIDIINNGSNQFSFSGGEMEGGFASTKDAPKIACYVLTLSGKKCKDPYPKDATMFYSSICAGCHGDDGKGLNGTYPDLTQNIFLGIKKRELLLKSIIKNTK
jgi:hypothetical protein